MQPLKDANGRPINDGRLKLEPGESRGSYVDGEWRKRYSGDYYVNRGSSDVYHRLSDQQAANRGLNTFS